MDAQKDVKKEDGEVVSNSTDDSNGGGSISLREAGPRDAWVKAFACTEEELIRAVAAVGPSVEHVRAYLSRDAANKH